MGMRRFVTVVSPLKSQALGAVGYVDDAAISEPVLLHKVAHDGIVPVCVNAEMGALFPAETDDATEHTVIIGITHHSVYHRIGSRVEPLALEYFCIGRVWTFAEHKGTYCHTAAQHKIAVV